MNSMLMETEKLGQLLLSHKQFSLISGLASEIARNGNYSTEPLYELDRSFSDILEPSFQITTDPSDYPYEDETAIYAPLQSARDEIEICNINYTSSYVIKYSGMHLEALAKYFIKNNSALGSLRFHNITLDKAVGILKRMNIFPQSIIEGYAQFSSLYSKAVEDIRKNQDKSIVFSPMDSIVSYYAARILGISVLKTGHGKNAILYIRKSDSPYMRYYIL